VTDTDTQLALAVGQTLDREQWDEPYEIIDIERTLVLSPSSSLAEGGADSAEVYRYPEETIQRWLDNSTATATTAQHEEEEEDNEYECGECGEVYYTSNALNGHVSKHTASDNNTS